MATTLTQAFQVFRSNLQITGLQGSTVSTRQANVRSVVAAGMTVLDTFLTGSYARDTMIAPLSEADIDIFVVLDASYFARYNSNTAGPQAGLLDAARRVLLQTYTTTPAISRNGQAVTVRFSDFTVDVVPAFYRQGGGFLIPSSTSGSWISTNPKTHVELIQASNAAHAGSLVPLIKMLKAWNREHGQFFHSFHLEILALQIFTGVTISDFPSGLRYFFDKVRALITQVNADPVGFGGDVGGYLNSQERIAEASRRMQRAYDQSLRAEDLARRNLVSEAITHWRSMLGNYFPAYG